MATVARFRPFKSTLFVVNSEFIAKDSTVNWQWAEEDLARSGLTADEIQADAPGNLRLKDGALAGYLIPYYGLDGKPLTAGSDLIMGRVRLKFPEFSREQRYTQRSGEELAKHNLPPYTPYFHPLSLSLPAEAGEAICCEGEKKTAAVLHRLGVPAFGIGGCQMWRNPDRSGAVHPWILNYLRQRNISTVRIVPDGDILRYDICNAYGTFARALELEGIKVRMVNPGGKIDDLLVGWARTATEHDSFNQLPEIPVNDLVQSPNSLIAQFNLAFKSDAKDRPIVYQHSSNITKILEGHRAAFPEIWRNTDTNVLMFGEEEARPGLTEMEVTNYFQHNLGFHNVKTHDILKCMTAQAKKNERSPFLEWVRAQQWDGKSRLKSWLQDTWGIPDSEYVQEVGLKWLVSSCARLDKPGTKIDWILITIGPGGTGKTSMPAVMFQGNYQPIYGEHNDKDLHMLMHSKLCIGFDEMDSFSKKEASMMRALITQTSDSFRPPYEASVEIFPRRFILYGCGNKQIFLHDQDGQRRYSILKVAQKLDFAGLEARRSQLWAEAWSVYNAGGLDYWEVKGNVENAAQFEIPNLMQERIESFLFQQKKVKYGGSKEGTWFVMSQLTDYLDMGKVGPNSSQMREVSECLIRAGCAQPGRKASRHPETNVTAKWWIYEEKDVAS